MPEVFLESLSERLIISGKGESLVVTQSIIFLSCMRIGRPQGFSVEVIVTHSNLDVALSSKT